MSDRTWGRLGRRRPYFLVGAMLATLALVVMPNSPYLWIAAGMLWILDASINISMEPFRAFVGRQAAGPPALPRLFDAELLHRRRRGRRLRAAVDPHQPVRRQQRGRPGQLPDSVRLAFYLGAVVFLAAVLWTVVSTREYSPEELAEFDETRR